MDNSKIASKIRDIADNYNTSAEKVHSTVWGALMAIAEEIDPEPAPRFKVGDFVEHNESKEQARITHIASPAYDAIEVKFTMSEELEVYSLSEFMIEFHVIPKSEVKVTLTLEGTVEHEDEDSVRLVYGKGRFDYSLVDFAQLSPAQAALVRELVEEK